MQYWLMKTEPETYSFEDLLREGKTVWDGVRNFQACNNLKAMHMGDQVLIYHSIREKAVVGLAEVTREHYPDPGDNPQQRWMVVEIRPVRPLKRRVPLSEIKARPDMADIPLVRQSRLSVMPLTQTEFERLIAMSEGRHSAPFGA